MTLRFSTFTGLSCCGVWQVIWQISRSNEFASRIQRRIELLPKNGQQASIDVESLKHCVTRQVEIVRRDRALRSGCKGSWRLRRSRLLLHEGYQAAHLHHGDIWQLPNIFRKSPLLKIASPAGSDPSLATLFLPRGLGKSHRPAQYCRKQSGPRRWLALSDVMHRSAMSVRVPAPAAS